MCKVQYVVHTAAQQPFTTTVELPGGQKVDAAIPGVVVELVSKDGTMTHTLRFVPEDVAAALVEFAPGAVIETTFVQIEPPPPVEAVEEEVVEEPAPAK